MNTWRTLESGTEQSQIMIWRVDEKTDSMGDGGVGALTRAVSVGGWHSAVAWVGIEGGQAGVVCVLAGEEGLSLFSWRQQAGLRGEASQRI